LLQSSDGLHGDPVARVGREPSGDHDETQPHGAVVVCGCYSATTRLRLTNCKKLVLRMCRYMYYQN
jgi:hypothetical protein